MDKIISLTEGFRIVFEENQRKVNIKEFYYRDFFIAKNWMEMTDFVALLESALKNKLGTGKKYQAGPLLIYGTFTAQYLVNFDFEEYQVVQFDIVQTQQIVSKLNKLLHMANKLYNYTYT